MTAERIRVVIEGDADDLRRALKDAGDNLRKLDTQAKASSVTQRKLAKDVDQVAKANNGLRRSLMDVNQSFMAMKNIVGVIKIPAMVVAVGALTQAAVGLAAGLTAVVGSLTQLSGLAVGFPILLTTAAQGMLVWKLASKDLTKALSGNQKALEGLTPAAREFVETLKGYKPLIDEFRKTAQEGLFPGLTTGLKSASKNADVLNYIIGKTAKTMGSLAREAGKKLGSKEWGRDLANIGDSNTKIMHRLGQALLSIVGVVKDLMRAAGPTFERLADRTRDWAHNLEKLTEHGRKTGELGKFFRDMEKTLTVTGSILGNLGSALWSILRGGKPTGDSLLATFDKTTERWANFLKSTEGRGKLQKVFREAEPVIRSVADLLADVTEAIFNIGTAPGASVMIGKLREIIPVLENIITSTTAAFGPVLIDTLITATQTFGFLVGNSGALNIFVRMLNETLKLLNDLLEAIPGLKPVLASAVAGASIYKALQIGAALSGITTLKRALGGLGAAGAAGAAGGKGGKGGKGAGAGGLTGILTTNPALALAGAGVVAVGAAGGLKAPGKTDYGLPTAGGADKLAQSLPIAKQVADVMDSIFGTSGRTKLQRFGLEIENLKNGLNGLTSDKLQDLKKEALALGDAHPGLKKLVDDIDTQLGTRLPKVLADNESVWGSFRTAQGKVLQDVKRQTQENFRAISSAMNVHTAAGKEAVYKNMMGAADAIQVAIDKGQISAKAGLAEIEKIMKAALSTYGITGKQADRYLKGQDTLTGKDISEDNVRPGGFQGGGFIGNPGEAGTDQRMIMVGDGEAVLTRHQQALADSALQMQYGMGLGDLFRDVQQPHWAARGAEGSAGSAGSGIIALGRRLQQMGYQVGEHPAFGGVQGGHVKNSRHYSAGALDVNADGQGQGHENAMLDRLAKMLGAQGWHYLWRVKGHFDHLHVDDGAGGGGGMVADVKLKAPKSGITGPIGTMVTSGLKAATRAAEGKANDILSRTVGGGSEAGGSSMGAYTKADLRKLWIKAGGAPGQANLMAAIALAESGGDPSIVNSIGASGLWQIHPPEPGVLDPMTNAKIAIRKLGTQGLAAWEAYTNGNYKRFMQRGGVVRAARGKPGVGKKKGKSPPKQKQQVKRQRGMRGGLPVPKVKDQAPAAKLIADLSGSLWRHEQQYGIDERLYAQSVEEPLRALDLPIPAGSLDTALSGVHPDDAGWVRSNNPKATDGDSAEVRMLAQINAHLNELAMLYDAKETIYSIAWQHHALVENMVVALDQELATLRKEIQAKRAQIERNREHLKELTDRLKHLQRRRKKKDNSKKENRWLDDEIRSTSKSISWVNTNYGKLTGELSELTGSFADVTGDRSSYHEARKSWDFENQNYQLDLGDIRKEIQEWVGYGGTAPKLALGAGAAADPVFMGGDIAQAVRTQAAKDAGDFGLLLGFAQTGLKPMRMLGKFAHGIDEVAQTGLAVIHQGEKITADPYGPFGVNRAAPAAPPHVEIHLLGDAGPIMRDVRVMVDGQIAQANVVAARQGRLMGAAAGGRRA